MTRYPSILLRENFSHNTALIPRAALLVLLNSYPAQYMAKYVNKAGYYGLKNIDGRITDPETRLSDDMDEFVTMLSSLMMDVVDPVRQSK